MAAPGFQTLPGGAPSCLAPPSSVWVKRWELKWMPNSADDPADSNCAWQQVATCSWYQGEVVLPAVKDWPRWRTDTALPADEYYRVTYVPSYSCPPSGADQCQYGGLVQTWQQVFTRIETPRALRWLTAAQACAPQVAECTVSNFPCAGGVPSA